MHRKTCYSLNLKVANLVKRWSCSNSNLRRDHGSTFSWRCTSPLYRSILWRASGAGRLLWSASRPLLNLL